MRFTTSVEQRDFAAGLRSLLGGPGVAAANRAWGRGEAGPGRKLWAQLAEFGVLALAVPERRGGLDAHPAFLATAFEELGRAAVVGPLVESVAVLPVLLAGSPDATRLEELAAGEFVASLAMPPHVPFALDGAEADAVYLVEGSRLRAATVVRELASVDQSRHLAELDAGEVVADEVDTERAFRVGALATAGQILGAGTALLELATGYAKQRVQFGRPIGGFQAVKHLLADALVGLELARPLLYGGAVAYAEESPTLARDVSAAKVACTEAAYRAARVSLQVHGAIGYTEEHAVAPLLTRVRALCSAWGTQSAHRARVLAALG